MTTDNEKMTKEELEGAIKTIHETIMKAESEEFQLDYESWKQLTDIVIWAEKVQPK